MDFASLPKPSAISSMKDRGRSAPEETRIEMFSPLKSLLGKWLLKEERATVAADVDLLSEENDPKMMLAQLVSIHSGIPLAKLRPEMSLQTALGISPFDALEFFHRISNVIDFEIPDREIRKAETLEDLITVAGRI